MLLCDTKQQQHRFVNTKERVCSQPKSDIIHTKRVKSVFMHADKERVCRASETKTLRENDQEALPGC